jgi:hypothetical protein
MAFHPFRQVGLKLVSVGLAALLWWTVAGEPTVERNLRVPLQFQNLSESLQIVGEPPGGIDVRVRGSSGALGRLQPGEVVALLDLGAARPGFRMFNVFKEHVRAPFGVSVEQVMTPTVPLELERLVARVAPIMPSLEGDPAPGFVVGAVTSDPSTVEVLGPENRLPRVIEATTEPVSVEGATRPVQAVVTVGIADSTLQLREARTALVTVQIETGPLERAMTDIAVQPMNLPDGLEATLVPELVDVVVRGALDIVESLARDQVIASVDLTGLGRGEHRLPVAVAPVDGLEVVRAEPADVVVTIQ